MTFQPKYLLFAYLIHHKFQFLILKSYPVPILFCMANVSYISCIFLLNVLCPIFSVEFCLTRLQTLDTVGWVARRSGHGSIWRCYLQFNSPQPDTSLWCARLCPSFLWYPICLPTPLVAVYKHTQDALSTQ